MIGFLIQLIIIILVLGLIYWAIGMLPIPEPFKRVAMVAMIVILVLYIIGALLPLAGGWPQLNWHR